MHSITASICTHHIRYSGTITTTSSSSETDNETPFCPSCEAYQAISAELVAAQTAFDSVQQQAVDSIRQQGESSPVVLSDYKAAKTRLHLAKALYASDRAHREALDDPKKPTLDADGRPAYSEGDHEVLWVSEEENQEPLVPRRRGLRARIANPDQHRSESEYRHMLTYKRGNRKRYRPGRYADQTGEGFWDTSKMELEVTEAHAAVDATPTLDGKDKPLPPLPAEEPDGGVLLDEGCNAVFTGGEPRGDGRGDDNSPYTGISNRSPVSLSNNVDEVSSCECKERGDDNSLYAGMSSHSLARSRPLEQTSSSGCQQELFSLSETLPVPCSPPVNVEKMNLEGKLDEQEDAPNHPLYQEVDQLAQTSLAGQKRPASVEVTVLREEAEA